MGSLFDTRVRNRRNHTPWATIALLRFIREMVLNATGDPQNHAVILRATYRGDVASRMWFELNGPEKTRSVILFSRRSLICCCGARRKPNYRPAKMQNTDGVILCFASVSLGITARMIQRSQAASMHIWTLCAKATTAGLWKCTTKQLVRLS